MSRFKQYSFAGGEIAPAMWGRSDQTKYQTGARTMRNFMVRREGGATNRPGFQYCGSVKTSAKATVLIPFVFDDANAYVLEFGDLYIRFWQQASPVAIPGVVAAYNGATAYTAGQLVTSVGITYSCILAGTAHTPASSPLYWYPLTHGVYEIQSPWTSDQVADIRFVQSGDVLTLAHPDQPPYKLTRVGATEWALVSLIGSPSLLNPAQAAPTSPASTGGTASSGTTSTYVVTAVNGTTYEESLASATTSRVDFTPTTSVPIVITWTGATGAGYYNIYRALNGAYGFIGIATGLTFSDLGYTADFSATGGGPPIDPQLFATEYPSAAGYFRQRLCFANTLSLPQTVWLGKTGLDLNFCKSIPLQDDDALTVTLRGRRLNVVRHLIDLDALIILTSDGVWTLEGDANGVIKPDSITLRQRGYRGSSSIPPVLIDNTALYIEARGSVVRDLQYDFQSNSYPGRDLTVFATHLFEGYTIVAWDYQQQPQSIVWSARDDGTLLGLTYVREHEVAGWHRHDSYTLGGQSFFESIITIPEGSEDAVYVVVRRVVNGSTVRYIERLASRAVTDVRFDARFVDSFLSYDGRNITATTLTLSGGTTWLVDEVETLTASAPIFVVGDVGNEYVLTIGGVSLRCIVTAYTSPTVVSVTPAKNVPIAFQGIATADWSRAADVLSGLDHLEGETVSILADGNVEPQRTVTGGSITLSRPFSVCHVGLPIEADLETLDVDNPQGETFTGKKAIVNRVELLVENSRGIFAGPDVDHLFELKQRSTEAYDEATGLATGTVDVRLAGAWADAKRVFIRQSDPLPLTVLSVVPHVSIGG